MMLTKIKIAGIAILLLGVLGGGAVVANQRLRADKPAATHLPEGPIALAEKDPAKPDPEKPARLDLFGDPLPEAAIARMGTVRFKVPSRTVTTGVYSPDGKVLATGGWYGGIWLWDPETGKRLRPLELESWPPVHALAFSPDGKELAVLVTGSGNKTITFDVETGKKLKQFDSSTVNTRSIAYAADGKTLLIVSSSLGAIDDEPVVHEVATGKELYRIVGHGGVVNSVRFTGDGKRIVSTDKDEMIRLWDAATGKVISQVDLLRLKKRLDGDCRLTAVSHDGNSLALMHNGETLLLWDPDAAKELKRLPSVPLYGVSLLTFTPDGKSLAVANQHTIRLWDVSSGKEIGPLAGKHYGFDVLALSADGKTLASGGAYEPLCLWETATGKELYRFEDIGTMRSLAFSPTGPVLAIGLEDGVQLWEVTGLGGSDKIVVKKRDRLEGDGGCLAFSPDGKALASAGYRTDYSLWDVETGKLRRRVERRKEWIDALVFPPTARIWRQSAIEAAGKTRGRLPSRFIFGTSRRARNIKVRLPGFTARSKPTISWSAASH
jgi:WD40 repeat protein